MSFYRKLSRLPILLYRKVEPLGLLNAFFEVMLLEIVLWDLPYLQQAITCCLNNDKGFVQIHLWLFSSHTLN